MDSPYKLGASDESKVAPAGESESIIGVSVAADNEKSPLGYPAVIPSKEDRSTPAFNGQDGLPAQPADVGAEARPVSGQHKPPRQNCDLGNSLRSICHRPCQLEQRLQLFGWHPRQHGERVAVGLLGWLLRCLVLRLAVAEDWTRQHIGRAL